MHITENEFIKVKYLDHRIATWGLIRALVIGCLFAQVAILILWLSGPLLVHTQTQLMNVGFLVITVCSLIQSTRKRLGYVLQRTAIFNTIQERG